MQMQMQMTMLVKIYKILFKVRDYKKKKQEYEPWKS